MAAHAKLLDQMQYRELTPADLQLLLQLEAQAAQGGYSCSGPLSQGAGSSSGGGTGYSGGYGSYGGGSSGYGTNYAAGRRATGGGGPSGVPPGPSAHGNVTQGNLSRGNLSQHTSRDANTRSASHGLASHGLMLPPPAPADRAMLGSDTSPSQSQSAGGAGGSGGDSGGGSRCGSGGGSRVGSDCGRHDGRYGSEAGEAGVEAGPADCGSAGQPAERHLVDGGRGSSDGGELRMASPATVVTRSDTSPAHPSPTRASPTDLEQP